MLILIALVREKLIQVVYHLKVIYENANVNRMNEWNLFFHRVNSKYPITHSSTICFFHLHNNPVPDPFSFFFSSWGDSLPFFPKIPLTLNFFLSSYSDYSFFSLFLPLPHNFLKSKAYQFVSVSGVWHHNVLYIF